MGKIRADKRESKTLLRDIDILREIEFRIEDEVSFYPPKKVIARLCEKHGIKDENYMGRLVNKALQQIQKEAFNRRVEDVARDRGLAIRRTQSLQRTAIAHGDIKTALQAEKILMELQGTRAPIEVDHSVTFDVGTESQRAISKFADVLGIPLAEIVDVQPTPKLSQPKEPKDS